MRKLRMDSKLQLEVLERYIAKRDENKPIESDLLALHIYLLANSEKANKKRIKEVIQRSNRYPIEKSLAICQENDIKDAWAYLELKKGDYLQAIKIAFEVKRKVNLLC